MPRRRTRRWWFPALVATLTGLMSATSAQAQALADSVRPYLVFAPKGEMWFLAAKRGKRMLLDIGRVDLAVGRDSAIAAGFRQAAAELSPVPVGTEFLLHGPWGREVVRATAVDSWNGRIVLVLSGSAAMDSAARGNVAVTVAAYRLETAAQAAATAEREAESGRRPATTEREAKPGPRRLDELVDTCDRAPPSGTYAARVIAVRDSVQTALFAEGPPIYPRLAARMSVHSSQVAGCFGRARVALAVSLRAGAIEWSRERIVLVDSLGAVRALPVDDFRFGVHDLLHALDADGDGIDDIAAIGRTSLAGATTILRYDAKTRRLVRLAAGFAWENR